MLTCPMCKKAVEDTTRQCPRCQTDLTLLADYVTHRQNGLAHAENLTRQGQLGEAVWAYLQVLEVDPDNPTARRQVGQVATAVRQFDRAAPGQKWQRSLRLQARLRALKESWKHGLWKAWLIGLAIVVLVASGFLIGFQVGYQARYLPSRVTDPMQEEPSDDQVQKD